LRIVLRHILLIHYEIVEYAPIIGRLATAVASSCSDMLARLSKWDNSECRPAFGRMPLPLSIAQSIAVPLPQAREELASFSFASRWVAPRSCRPALPDPIICRARGLRTAERYRCC
jgi:hypothetical protein